MKLLLKPNQKLFKSKENMKTYAVRMGVPEVLW
jgi:hypothetical protein